MGTLLAEHVYDEILSRLRGMRESGSLRRAVEAEVWGPAARNHRPVGPRLGDPCAGCGAPWPCPLIRDLLVSGILTRDLPFEVPPRILEKQHVPRRGRRRTVRRGVRP
jgi:hypothetical protein